MGQLHQHLLDMLGAKDHIDAGRIIGKLHVAALKELSGNSGQLQQPSAAAGLNEPFGDSEQLALPDTASGGDTRAQFEAWAKRQDHLGCRLWLEKYVNQTRYKSATTRMLWDCWQAAGAARQPVGVEPVVPQSIPEGWALVDLSSYAVLPQLPSEQMIVAGWPAGEMISECFDSLGAYADLIASYGANGSGIVHGKGQPAPAAVPAETFQAGVSKWMGQCFLPSLYSNMTERGDRMLEEVLELLQSHGYDQTRVATLVDYVYGRPVGEPAQEVGGVMVTLAGYCWVAGLDMHAEGARELERITQPEVMAKIRSKQEAKNALHFDTPLPGHATHPQPTAACVNIDAMRYRYLRAQPVEGGPWGTPRIAIPRSERAGEFANGDDADAAIDAAIAAQQAHGGDA
ncbi:hypothetical protein [Xanthomonas cannabis]|uniref:hypothetical protein n=1 Tax=Xanthomonas cannabis TaxID=1885674 RepID=UPI001ABBB5CA|nr:hypothetical protein [Xanthomonas cannabis]